MIQEAHSLLFKCSICKEECVFVARFRVEAYASAEGRGWRWDHWPALPPVAEDVTTPLAAEAWCPRCWTALHLRRIGQVDPREKADGPPPPARGDESAGHFQFDDRKISP